MAICDSDSCVFLLAHVSSVYSRPFAIVIHVRLFVCSTQLARVGQVLVDLCDTPTSHRWLWRLSPVHGPVAPREEFADAVEIRLGAAVVTPVTGCTRGVELF